MQRSELFSRIINSVLSATGISPYIPLFGDISENIAQWAKDNPEQADRVLDEVYRLIKQYKEGR